MINPICIKHRNIGDKKIFLKYFDKSNTKCVWYPKLNIL